jgi:hypothetical protein
VRSALDRFHVVRNRFLRWLVAYTPAILGVLLLADWLVGPRPGSFAHDLLRLSSLLTVIVEMVVLRLLFDRVPEALRLIWTRDLVRSSQGAEEPARTYLDFVRQFERALNARWAWLVGAILAVIGFVSTFPMMSWIRNGQWPNYIDPIRYYFYGNLAIAVLPLGYLMGLLAWRVGVIAYFVDVLGKRFELQVQPRHPDKCGGLKPLGDWCMAIAFLLLLPAFYFSFWGIAITFFPSSQTQVAADLWGGWYQQLLVVLCIGALFLFVQPLYSIHLEMEKRRREIQAELDELSHKIDEIMLELRTKADTLTPEQGKQRLETIEFMQKVHEQSKQIPTWPFDADNLRRFGIAQVVPVLSLIGTTKPFIPVIQSVLQFLPK